MSTAFEFIHVQAGYNGRMVLDDIDFKAGEGEMIGLLGPNGAGKSTLFRVLSGLITPFSGRVFLCGNEVRKMKAARRSRLMAVVPQEIKTPMAFTAGEMVAMGRLTILPSWQNSSADDRKIMEHAMVYADINELSDRPFDSLSGGEKQRVLIAMALAQEAKVILMDEPTTHLDANHALEIMQIMERLNQERKLTVLMISHDLNLAAEFCRRLILLDHGRIVADGAPNEVLREETLQEIYHCEMSVQTDVRSGMPYVKPCARHTRAEGATSAATNMPIHVIAGGGSGAEVLRQLVFNNFLNVTCGVLNEHDTDAQVCEALGIPAVLEKPFSPIGNGAYQQAENMAARARVVILCEVPFGPGNTINLRLAKNALKRGAEVLINDLNLQQRDYSTDQQATIIIEEMLSEGARPWRNLHELHQMLFELAPADHSAVPGNATKINSPGSG
jgi:iron complex transport system ATP-binding protein